MRWTSLLARPTWQMRLAPPPAVHVQRPYSRDFLLTSVASVSRRDQFTLLTAIFLPYSFIERGKNTVILFWLSFLQSFGVLKLPDHTWAGYSKHISLKPWLGEFCTFPWYSSRSFAAGRVEQPGISCFASNKTFWTYNFRAGCRLLSQAFLHTVLVFSNLDFCCHFV